MRQKLELIYQNKIEEPLSKAMNELIPIFEIMSKVPHFETHGTKLAIVDLGDDKLILHTGSFMKAICDYGGIRYEIKVSKLYEIK